MRATVLLALLLAACGRTKAPPSDRKSEKPNAAVPAPARAASADPELRAAVVHVPSGVGASEKVPLVVVLHGLGASSASIDRFSDVARFAQAKRIAWVAPDGTKDRRRRQFWNAGTSCCNFDDIQVDHVGALRALITRATATYPIDPKRVYVVGYSNGGFMAHRLACDLGGFVAGVVSVAGAGPGGKTDAPCRPSAPVRVLQVHGDADPVVNIDGGPLFADASYPTHLSAARTVGDWAERFGCRPAPKAAGSIDFEAKLAGSETKVSRFEDCKGGAVELWTVVGGNHYVGFREPSYEAMWRFLSGS